MAQTERIITAERSIIVAADVEPDAFGGLVSSLGGIGLGGVKIGFEIGLGMGLQAASEIVRQEDPTLRIIYDHQKAGNDIPDTGKNFARAMKRGGVDAAILFPFTGDDVEERWIHELQEEEIGVIVGSEMTHVGITDRIKKGAFEEIFMQAMKYGVRDFVVPGNKPERVAHWKAFFDEQIGEGHYDLFAPGFVTQGGDISAAGEQAGRNFHPIVGRGIYEAEDITAAAQKYARQLNDVPSQ